MKAYRAALLRFDDHGQPLYDSDGLLVVGPDAHGRQVVRAAGGRVRLVKIDIDKNKQLVAQLAQMGLPLQSVPTVVAFWKGQILDLFQGALPESEVKRFIEGLLKQAGGQMPTADLLGEAKAALEEGDATTALQLFGALAQQEPENADALAGVARCLMTLGEEDQALQVIESVPEKLRAHAEIASIRSALELAAEGREARAKLAEFESRLAADPNDHAARIDLANPARVQRAWEVLRTTGRGLAAWQDVIEEALARVHHDRAGLFRSRIIDNLSMKLLVDLLDRNRGQRGIDFVPVLGGVGLAERIGGEGLVNVGRGQCHFRATIGFGEGDAVKSDLDFDDIGDAAFLALFELRFLHATRSHGDIGVLRTDACAEQFHAGAGSRRFDHR